MHSKTDTVQSSVEALRYPWEKHPGPTEVVEVMPGVLWARLKLPFRLNHVNIYLLADGDGWAMVDSGFGNEESIAAWTALFEGPLAHVKITRLIVTHSHPDHVGLAGWIVERFNCPLYMSQVEYLQSVYHQNRGTEERKMAQRLFFRRHGMDESLTDQLLDRGQDYLKRVSILPPSYRRISHGDEISIGTRRFKVITGGGHALDQVMAQRGAKGGLAALRGQAHNAIVAHFDEAIALEAPQCHRNRRRRHLQPMRQRRRNHRPPLALGFENRLEVVLLRNVDGVFHLCADISLTAGPILVVADVKPALCARPKSNSRDCSTADYGSAHCFRHLEPVTQECTSVRCCVAAENFSRTVVFRYNDCAITLQRRVPENTCVGQIWKTT